MNEIELTLNALADLVKTIDTTHPPGDRVWVHPGESFAIQTDSFPFVVITKMNAETGSWGYGAFGEGKHKWSILIAVYIAEGPVIITSSDQDTVDAIETAHEWYKKLADLLFANMKLNDTVDIIGDGEGRLFDYVTDNILWDGKQYWGHLFIVPVTQSIIQGVSS